MLSLVHRQSSCILVSPQLFICHMEIPDPFLRSCRHRWGTVQLPSFSKWACVFPWQGAILLFQGAARFQPPHNAAVSCSFIVVFAHGGGFHCRRCGQCLTSVPSYNRRFLLSHYHTSDIQLGRETWKMQRNADRVLFCVCGVPSTVGSYSVALVSLITQIITI